jgi:hypothetical protein
MFVRNVYSVIDESGVLVHPVMSLTHGEEQIAQDFGISHGDLEGLRTKMRNSKSFRAFLSADGVFREIVGARDFDYARPKTI